MIQVSEDERRNYFRIQDRAVVEIIALHGGPTRPPEAYFQASSSDELMRELNDIRSETQTVLRQIQEKHKDIAAYFNCINHQIDAVARTVASFEGDTETVDINISEAGIDLFYEDAIEIGSCVAMRIVLLPKHISVYTIARCMSLEPQSEGFRAAFAFEVMSEADNYQVGRHVIQTQAAQARAKRQF